MFVAVSRSLTKIDPVLIRFWLSGLLSPGRIARQRLTESHHDSVEYAVVGIS